MTEQWLRLTLRSAVSSDNDNVIGDFRDERTAYLIGRILLAIDNTDCPVYSYYTADPVDDRP